MLRLAALIVLICCNGLLFSQLVDTLEASRLRLTADSIYRTRSDYATARSMYLEAANLFQESGFLRSSGICRMRAGNSSFRMVKYEQALQDFRDLAVFCREVNPSDQEMIFTSLSNIGASLAVLGRHAEAKSYVLRSLDARLKIQGKMHKRTGESLYNLGTIYLELGEYDLAYQHLTEALPVYIHNYGEKDRRVSAVYDNLGILYDKWGDPNRALEYYGKANQITTEIYGEDFWLLAYGYHNSAISWRLLGDYDKALASLQRSVSIGKPYGLHDLIGGNYSEFGHIYLDLNQKEKALESFQYAYDYISENMGGEFPKLITYSTQIARTSAQLGNLDTAKAYFAKALRIGESAFKGKHPYIANTHVAMANIHRNEGRYAKALESCELAANAVSRTPGPGQANKASSASTLMEPTIFLETLILRAEILQAQYEDQEDPDMLTQALSSVMRASEMIDEIRSGYLTEQSKLYLQGNAVPAYEMGLSICHQLYRLNQDPQYLYQAFVFSEKNKATILAGALQASSMRSFHGIPDLLIQQEKTLKTEMDEVEELLANAHIQQDSSSRELIPVLEDRQFHLRHSYDSILTAFRSQYPNYFDLKFNAEVIPAKEAQRNLEKGETMLSYFWGDSLLYVISITRDIIEIRSIANPDVLEKQIEKLIEGIQQPANPYSNYAELAHSLYMTLIGEHASPLSQATRLIIIPDGILNYLSFEALLRSAPANLTTDRELDYLIRSHDIQYALSASLLYRPHKLTQSDLAYVGFAPEYSSGQQENGQLRDLPKDIPMREFAPLAGALEEVQHAHRILGGTAFVADSATEGQFKSLEDWPNILHLAMHAEAHDDNPLNSRLIFTPNSDSTEDGSLYAYEIYRLRLGSQLAILSGCNTGYGEIKRGEGVMSLSRAFMFAGCPSITMSLWPARDRSTQAIMTEFCQNLLEGSQKSEALRDAKLQYLESADPLKAHPGYWAAFVLVGNADRLDTGKGNLLLWSLLSIVLLGGIGASTYWFWNRNRSSERASE